MDQYHFRSYNSVPGKSITQSVRLNMSTVEEDYEEQNDTVIKHNGPEDDDQSGTSQPKMVLSTPQVYFNLPQTKKQNLSEELFRQVPASQENSESISVRSSDRSSDNEDNSNKQNEYDKVKERINYSMGMSGSLLNLNYGSSLHLKNQSGEDFQISSSPSPQRPPLIHILNHVSSLRDNVNHETLSQIYNMKVNLDITDFQFQLDPKQFCEEFTISRRVQLFTSVLQQYFARKLQSPAANNILFLEDAALEDEPKFRISSLSPEVIRGRAITSTNKQIQNQGLANGIRGILAKGCSPPLSPRSGAASSKSAKQQEFMSLKKLVELSNTNIRKNSFSMALQQQQQKQMKSSFLRRASKRTRQFQLLVSQVTEVSDSQNSDSSDIESQHSSELSKSIKISSYFGQIANQPDYDDQLAKKNILLKHMSTIEEEEKIAQISPIRIQPNNRSQSITFMTQSTVNTNRLSVKQKEQEKEDLRAKLGHFVLRLREGFSCFVGNKQLRRQRSFEDDEDRIIRLKLIGAGTLISLSLIVILFFLAVLKYEIKKL